MELVWSPPIQLGVTSGWMGNLLPIWGQRLGAWGSSISYCSISPQMGSRGRKSVKSNWFFKQCHGFGDSTHHNMHVITGMKQNDQFCCQKPKTHLWGVSVPPQHRVQWCLPPVWRCHQAECYHFWLIPGHMFDERVLFHHLEYNHGLPKQLQWTWWTYRGEGRNVSGKEGYTLKLREIPWSSQLLHEMTKFVTFKPITLIIENINCTEITRIVG